MFVPYYVIVIVAMVSLFLTFAFVHARLQVRKQRLSRLLEIRTLNQHIQILYQNWTQQGELARAWEILSSVSDLLRTYVSALSGVNRIQVISKAPAADATVAMDESGTTLPFERHPEWKVVVLALHQAEITLLESVSLLVRAGGSRTLISQSLKKVIGERAAALADPLAPELLDSMIGRLVQKVMKLPTASNAN